MVNVCNISKGHNVLHIATFHFEKGAGNRHKKILQKFCYILNKFLKAIFAKVLEIKVTVIIPEFFSHEKYPIEVARPSPFCRFSFRSFYSVRKIASASKAEIPESAYTDRFISIKIQLGNT